VKIRITLSMILPFVVAVLAVPLQSALAGETHTITARSTSYDPVVLNIEPGDTVSWTNMGGHFNLFEEGLIPEGAESWSSSMGENVSRTFDVEGVYLYQCPPHFAMGMVGAIIVGEPVNIDQIEENATGMYRRAVAQVKQAIE
jgi:pseudoazurin